MPARRPSEAQLGIDPFCTTPHPNNKNGINTLFQNAFFDKLVINAKKNNMDYYIMIHPRL